MQAIVHASLIASFLINFAACAEDDTPSTYERYSAAIDRSPPEQVCNVDNCRPEGTPVDDSTNDNNGRPGRPGGAGPVQCTQPDENRCFGAVGANCDGAGAFMPDAPLSLELGCVGDWCHVNAGSWAHDECCAQNPNGLLCAGPVVGAAQMQVRSNSLGLVHFACEAEWDKAVNHTLHGLAWTRRVDRCRSDSDGRVNFDEYCAPGSTILHRRDRGYCCDRISTPYNGRDHQLWAQFQGVMFAPDFQPQDAVVCLSRPEPPRDSGVTACRTDADCTARDAYCHVNEHGGICMLM